MQQQGLDLSDDEDSDEESDSDHGGPQDMTNWVPPVSQATIDLACFWLEMARAVIYQNQRNKL